MLTLCSRAARLFSAFQVLVAPVCANVWIVDQHGGPGVDFTDIPPAIAAVPPGDVLHIRPGLYSSFMLDKGLTLIGSGAIVSPPVFIQNVPANARAVIVGLESFVFDVRDCQGAVVLQELAPALVAEMISVVNCRDVRLARTAVQAQPFSSASALAVHGSRVEVVDCWLHGADNPIPYGPPFATPGGAGLRGSGSARIHCVATDALGGIGGPGDVGLPAGPGGAGIEIAGTDVLIVAGDGGNQVTGGAGGSCFVCGDCSFNALGGPGLSNLGGSAWYSGVTFTGAAYTFGPSCTPATAPGIQGGSNTLQVPSDPILQTSGTPAAGAVISFTVSAPPGSAATLHFGRNPLVVATPPILIERLSDHARSFSLGVVPASGSVSRSFTVSNALSMGTLFLAQAEVVLPGGELRRTNSTPIVVR